MDTTVLPQRAHSAARMRGPHASRETLRRRGAAPSRRAGTCARAAATAVAVAALVVSSCGPSSPWSTAVVGVAHAEHTFAAHPAMTWSLRGDQRGCPARVFDQGYTAVPAAAVLSHATTPTGTAPQQHQQRGAQRRRIAVLRAENATAADVERLLDTELGALLVVLPRADALSDGFGDAAMRAQWAEVEIAVSQRRWRTPLYFAVDDDGLADLVAMLQRGIDDATAPSPQKHSAFASESDMKVAVMEPNKPEGMNKLRLHNLYGTLTSTSDTDGTGGGGGGGGDGGGEVEGKGEPRTVLLAAGYDTFGVAPTMPGSKAAASGVAAALELLRLLSRLYSGSRSRTQSAGVNVLLLLTAGDGLDHAGTRAWLKTAKGAVLRSVDFALYLDSHLAGGFGDADARGSRDALYVHTSHTEANDAAAAALFGSLRAATGVFGAPLRVVHSKVNVSRKEADWPHELFALKRVLSATLSSRPTPRQPYTGVPLLDAPFDAAVLARNVRVVAHAVGTHIYGAEAMASPNADADIDTGDSGGVAGGGGARRWSALSKRLGGPKGVDEAALATRVRVLATHTRSTAAVTDVDAGGPQGAGGVYLSELWKELNQLLAAPATASARGGGVGAGAEGGVVAQRRLFILDRGQVGLASALAPMVGRTVPAANPLLDVALCAGVCGYLAALYYGVAHCTEWCRRRRGGAGVGAGAGGGGGDGGKGKAKPKRA